MRFGLRLYLILFYYRLYVIGCLKVKEVPEPAKPTFVILCAPASLLLGRYMNSFATKSLAMSVLLFIFSTAFYLIVLCKYSKSWAETKIFTGFSAFTFPLVITALSTNFIDIL